MKKYKLSAGSIIIWEKKMNWVSKFIDFFKCIKKPKEYCITILKDNTEIYTVSNNLNWLMFEPRKKYNATEIAQLKKINPVSPEDIIATINIIRTNTIKPAKFDLNAFYNNGYYKRIESKEAVYIY